MKKPQLNHIEKDYLLLIKENNSNFMKAKFDINHVFKEETKDSAFYYFKKMLKLEPNFSDHLRREVGFWFSYS